MENKHTHISILLDCSGSMASIRNDMLGGLNTFIEDQKKVEGYATLTFATFDSDFSDLRYTKHINMQDLNAVDKITEDMFRPNGGTPLLDAVGKHITELASHIDEIAEADRPEKVLVMIITDGEENSSQVRTLPEIKDLISRMEKERKWSFAYMGANQDAFAVGSGMGLNMANSRGYEASTRGIEDMTVLYSASVANFRKSASVESFAFCQTEEGSGG